MDKTLIIFATYIEARAFIEKLQATQHTILTNKYISLKYDIVISGLGSIRAAVATMEQGKKYSLIINVGFSGIINKQLSIGSFHEIETVSKLTFADAFIKKEDSVSFSIINDCFPKIKCVNNTGSISLTSSDIPIRNLITSSYIDTDLVDMEAYGIAFASKKLGIPYKIFKLATDFPCLEERKHLQENYQNFSTALSHFLSDLIL